MSVQILRFKCCFFCIEEFVTLERVFDFRSVAFEKLHDPGITSNLSSKTGTLSFSGAGCNLLYPKFLLFGGHVTCLSPNQDRIKLALLVTHIHISIA